MAFASLYQIQNCPLFFISTYVRADLNNSNDKSVSILLMSVCMCVCVCLEDDHFGEGEL